MASLPPNLQEFVLHWGKMGARWGVNRTVAQIHALLIVSPQPLHAEEIAETLSVSLAGGQPCSGRVEGLLERTVASRPE